MAQQDFALRWGYSDGASIKVVAHSLVVDDIVITIDGSDTTLLSMAILGSDSGTAKTEAFFVDSGTVSGLSAFTTYTYTAVQAGNSISGSFTTAPNADSDFAFFIGTCDAIVTTNNNATQSGMYAHMRTYAETPGNLPVTGLLMLDDHYGYMDLCSMDDSAGTGHVVSGAFSHTNALTYEYALGAGCALGLYEDATDTYIAAGHNTDRIWCMQNIPVFPQKGDHDSGINEMSWSLDKDVAGSAKYDASLLVWDAILKPLQPPAIDGGNSNAWGFSLGCVYICAPDAITTGSGDAADGSVAPTNIYGNTQIDNVLDAMNNSQPFKMLGLANGIRYLNSTAFDNHDGSQNPISLHSDEYARLMTANTGLMGLDATNGVTGKMFTVHGDYHALRVQRNENTVGTNDESFYSFQSGTLTGSANFTKFARGTAYDGVTVEYADSVADGNDYWCLRVEVYGSKAKKECHVIAMDGDGNDVWTKIFIDGQFGNLAKTTANDARIGSSIIKPDDIL